MNEYPWGSNGSMMGRPQNVGNARSNMPSSYPRSPEEVAYFQRMQEMMNRVTPPPVATSQFNTAYQQPEMSPFIGRYVEQVNEIVPNEVPMDGRIGLYPTKDLTTIFLKTWTPEGKITTLKYILDPDQMTTPSTVATEEDFKKEVFERLNALEQMFTKQNNNRNGKHNNQPREENKNG